MLRRRWPIVVLVTGIMLIASLNTLGMISDQDRQDSYASHYGFKVEITSSSGDTNEGIWRSVRHSGLTITESADKNGNGKGLGRVESDDVDWGKLTLSGPVLQEKYREDLKEWYTALQNGGDVFRDVVITLIGPDGTEMGTYDFHDCFMSSYSMTPLDDKEDDNELQEAIEITIGHVDEYPEKEHHNNKGKFVSSLAHSLNRPIAAENVLDPSEYEPLMSGDFVFTFDGLELPLTRVEMGSIEFELDTGSGRVETYFGDWILEKPYEESRYNLEDIYNEFMSGDRDPGSTSGSLELLNNTNETARRFDFTGVFPVKYETVKIDGSDGSTELYERLVIQIYKIILE